MRPAIAGLGALLLALSIITYLDMRTIRRNIEMQGAQRIMHQIETPSGPAEVTTTRNHGESVSAWYARHEQAIAEAMQ